MYSVHLWSVQYTVHCTLWLAVILWAVGCARLWGAGRTIAAQKGRPKGNIGMGRCLAERGSRKLFLVPPLQNVDTNVSRERRAIFRTDRKFSFYRINRNRSDNFW